MTTNFMGFFKPLDYRAWAPEQDIVSLDSYSDPHDPWATGVSAAQYDLTRSLGDGAPWMLMEQVTSQVNWRPRNALKQPGQMRLWSLQAVARGARAIMFFQWRAAKAGAEKFHGALVPHVGVENSRIWREVTALGNELKEFGVVAKGAVEARAGILVDWQSWWALEQDSKPSTDVKFLEQVQQYYGPLYAQNITVDFVFPDSDLWAYQVLFVPNLYLVSDETAAKLERYVANGGVLVVSFFSGIVDPNEHIRLGGYPAPFRKFLGIRVEEFCPDGRGPGRAGALCRRQRGAVRPVGRRHRPGGGAGAGHLHRQLLCRAAGRSPNTPTATAAPSISAHGWRPKPWPGCWAASAPKQGVHAPLDVPQGVEVVARRGGDNQRYLFVLNHRPEAVTIRAAPAHARPSQRRRPQRRPHPGRLRRRHPSRINPFREEAPTFGSRKVFPEGVSETRSSSVQVSIAFQTDKPLAAYGPLAAAAEAYGFDAVTVYNDMLYQPAWLPLLEMARATQRVQLGVAAVNPFTCHPINIAGNIALIDEASQGRAYLGVARGAWLDFVGLHPKRGVTALAEALRCVRHLLRRSTEPLPGEFYPLAGGDTLRWPVAPPRTALLARHLGRADDPRLHRRHCGGQDRRQRQPRRAAAFPARDRRGGGRDRA